MMTRRNILLVALALFAVVLLRNKLTGSGGGKPAGRAAPAVAAGEFGDDAPRRVRRGRRGAAPAVSEVVELRLQDLEPRPGVYREGRDPFRFGPAPIPPPPPPPPPPTAAQIAAAQAAAAAEAERQRLAAIEAARPKPPALNLTYLGSFGAAKRRVAVLTDGKETYNALEGDTIDGKFIVDRIGFESVDLKFVGFPDEPAKRLAIGGPPRGV